MTEPNKQFNAQSGASGSAGRGPHPSGVPPPGFYPPPGGAYPPQGAGAGAGYPPPGAGYPPQGGGVPPVGGALPPQDGFDQPGQFQPAYGAMPPYWMGGAMAVNHPKAIPALVMGIVSICLAVVTLMLSVMSICAVLGIATVAAGIVLGILAIIYGNKAKNEIDASPSMYGARSQAMGGLICGVIGLIANVLILFLVAAVIILLIFILSGGYY